MKKIFLLIAFICITTSSAAQINEIGIFAGGSNYIGDIGSEYYINPNKFMGGVILKRNLNPRIALRGTFTFASIRANDLDANNKGRNERAISFSNSIKELAAGIEFNYLEYNLDDYRFTHTPYIIVEFAAFNYSTIAREVGPEQYEYKNKTSFALPFGLGYKTKLAGSFAVALEVRARYTFGDDLDYNNSEISALRFGNPNSNDWYILSGLSIVYTFGRPPCYSTPY